MSSPKNRRKNVTMIPTSPTSMNPFISFLNTNKLSTIQRTLQSRRLFNKINKVNAIISDEKVKWTSSPNSTDIKSNQDKILILINKSQAPLQINPRIRMRKTIENIMRVNKIETPLVKQRNHNLLTSPRETDIKTNSNEANVVDLKSIKKSIKQIGQISRYFDKVYKIDKKQKYLKIDTIDYWKNIGTTPTKKKELIEIYNRVHKDEKFTFTQYQREYESKWLDILKNLQEKDKASILFLINGGHHEEDIEEQIKAFDPNKIIQKLEYKKFLDEKKLKKSQTEPPPQISIFVPKTPKIVAKTGPTSEEKFVTQKQSSLSKRNLSEEKFVTQRQSSLSKKNFKSESKSIVETPFEKNKGKLVFPERQLKGLKPKTCSSFNDIPEVNSPSKSIRSQMVLKNFLHDNLPQSSQTLKNLPLQRNKTKISLNAENEKLQQLPEKDQKIIVTSVKKSKKSKFNNTTNDFQECSCKHVHNIQCYQLKKDHKSIFKIPSALPPTQKTFMEIRRASNMQFADDPLPHPRKLDYEMIQHLAVLKEKENVFLQRLKTNINESYENKEYSIQKNDYILEK